MVNGENQDKLLEDMDAFEQRLRDADPQTDSFDDLLAEMVSITERVTRVIEEGEE